MKKILILTYIVLFSAFTSLFLSEGVSAETVKGSDYSNPNNWISKPENQVYPVDVFYVYPTACAVEDLSKEKTCKIDHKGMRKQARKLFSVQATAFDTVANLYAPFYSQVDARIFANSKSDDVTSAVIENKQELADIYSALDYYFQNINKGKPFILASHSQGSVVMRIILSDYMKTHPEYYKNMVAAYVIGFPITDEYFKENPHLKFAEKGDDTGVIISYNTQTPDKSGANLVYKKGQYVINPLNWKRTTKYAPTKENLGSLDDKTMQIITPGIADARIDKNGEVIICSSVKDKKYHMPMPELFGYGSFHGQEYQFYYMNLRQNAKDRVKKYFSKMK